MGATPVVQLGDRMKEYEISGFHDPRAPCVMRLDGHSFSKWTRGFAKPFDPRLHSVFVSTCEDLLRYFPQTTTVYTQSDEITLVFPRGLDMFNGRVQKICSISAGYASARFNHHLGTVPDVPDGKVGNAIFDCRVFNVPSETELLNNVIWRCKHDCCRNSKSMFARQYFPQKQLQHMTSNQQVDLVKERCQADYNTLVPDWAKYGTTLKKRLVNETHTNVKTQQSEMCSRTRVMHMYLPYSVYSTEMCSFLTAKYADIVPAPPVHSP